MLNVSTCIPPTPKSPDGLLYLYQDYNEGVRRRCVWQLDKAFLNMSTCIQRVRIACISKNLNLRIVLNFNFSQLELHHEFFFNDRWHKAHEYRYTALLLGLNNDTVIINKKLDIVLMTKYIHSPISNIHQCVNLVKRKVCINFTLKV